MTTPARATIVFVAATIFVGLPIALLILGQPTDGENEASIWLLSAGIGVVILAGMLAYEQTKRRL